MFCNSLAKLSFVSQALNYGCFTSPAPLDSAMRNKDQKARLHLFLPADMPLCIVLTMQEQDLLVMQYTSAACEEFGWRDYMQAPMSSFSNFGIVRET